MSENDVFCEKVIKELNKVINDPQTTVQSFEIISVPFKQNKSPVRVVDNHLGIESWCLKYVYQYAHRFIINQRRINRYPSLTIVKYLNCAILINPDVATFWNIRRHLVERVQLNLTQEFHFSALVLSKKPKSSEAFFYRRWLYSFQSGEAIDLAVEISLCERCAERKNGNYHAWNHRQWCLQKSPNLLPYEIIKTEKFIRKNVADYSAYYHRHFVLMRLFDLQYFDIHDTNLNELYQFVNANCSLSDDSKINNMNDLALHLLPNISLQSINANKLNSFLYVLNLIIHDLIMMNELTQMHGKYEAFNCYRRIIIKLAIDICRLVNSSNYLMSETFIKNINTVTSQNETGVTQSQIIDVFVKQLDFQDGKNIKFAELFY
ncbi:hypothetical protein PVAND_002749 [Polypedilum vanderplanki]|uniref:Uncharacterized protein n=1 Tax=Polypedilum vanderplanki TaxID=319348 RepID=A0A9J6BRY5_POLVA|nr:hypothetical protein PVAND_002749 [Polypedilum vanderplanki]